MNDYELVHWPRKEAEKAQQNETASDLTVAFRMIEDTFGGAAGEDDMEIENIENGAFSQSCLVLFLVPFFKKKFTIFRSGNQWGGIAKAGEEDSQRIQIASNQSDRGKCDHRQRY